jgi:hypothetical protein
MRFTKPVSFRVPPGESGLSITLTSFNYRNVETATFYVLRTEFAGRLALLFDGCGIGTDSSGHTTDERQLAQVDSGGVNLADGRWRPKYAGAQPYGRNQRNTQSRHFRHFRLLLGR